MEDKRKIIKNILRWLFKMYSLINIKRKFLKIHFSDKPVIVSLFNPSHGNVGDHGILVAERKFLKDNIKNYIIITLTDVDWKFNKKTIRQLIKIQDIIIIHGGGFIGTLAFVPGEQPLREILSTFISNKIIIFPQTIFFENSDFGHKEFINTMELWKSHVNLTVFLREKKSFDLVKDYMQNQEKPKIHLVPDIVLYLNAQKEIKRKTILLVFRSDNEKISDENIINNISNKVSNLDYKIRVSDMIVNYQVFPFMSKSVVNKKMKEFRKAKLVITDRLHGMIFAAITGTPVIALNNISGKVYGVYEFLSKFKYVKFVNNLNDIDSIIPTILNFKSNEYDNKEFMKYYDLIIKAIYE